VWERVDVYEDGVNACVELCLCDAVALDGDVFVGDVGNCGGTSVCAGGSGKVVVWYMDWGDDYVGVGVGVGVGGWWCGDSSVCDYYCNWCLLATAEGLEDDIKILAGEGVVLVGGGVGAGGGKERSQSKDADK